MNRAPEDKPSHAPELLPGPFCAASVTMSVEGSYCQVICQDCGSKAAEYPNPDLAALAWNTRTNECPNCHNANKHGDYEGPTCEVCMGDGFVTALIAQAPALKARVEELEKALTNLYEWYDRDGSVGGASDVFEDNRAALASEAKR